jgi:hypothetical protein
MKSSSNKNENKNSLNSNEIERIIIEGRKKGRESGAKEFKSVLNNFKVHAINNEHLLDMVHDYFQECQSDYIKHRSYYKLAVTYFRNSKDKIIANAQLHNIFIDPENEEEENPFVTSMYLTFAKEKPNFGMGIDILEEINDLENVVANYESLEEKKRRVDSFINETNERLNNKEGELESIVDEDHQTFKTVWEAVLYHSVLVDAGIRKHYSKKEIPELVDNMFLNKQKKKISHHSFYNKLLAIPNARKGEKTNEGRYGISDYESVKDTLSTEFPEALSILKNRYFYSQLC